MRISIRLNDPGHGNHMQAKAMGKRVSVKLNGVQQYHCVTADDYCGLVVRYVLDENGNAKFDHERKSFIDEVVHGKVEIELQDEMTL